MVQCKTAYAQLSNLDDALATDFARDHGAHGVSGHFDVPMIGRTDNHDIDFLAGQQIAVVFETARRAAETRFGLISNMTVDIADRNDVSIHGRFVSDHAALVSESDDADAWAFVRALGGCVLGSRAGVWRQARSETSDRGCSNEISATGTLRHCKTMLGWRRGIGWGQRALYDKIEQLTLPLIGERALDQHR